VRGRSASAASRCLSAAAPRRAQSAADLLAALRALFIGQRDALTLGHHEPPSGSSRTRRLRACGAQPRPQGAILGSAQARTGAATGASVVELVDVEVLVELAAVGGLLDVLVDATSATAAR